MPIPANPKIYHIVHGNRLPSIVKDGGLYCDAVMIKRQNTGTTIGMMNIKERRLQMQLPCYPDTHIGDYVPFYFCPRSVMLYIIYRANHSELTYRDGQDPIVHLEADLHQVVDWAEANELRWAFSLSNAAASYTRFQADRNQLGEINWAAVATNDWNRNGIMEFKQAEFLIHYFFPWHLVSRIGVISSRVGNRVMQVIDAAQHKPKVEVMQSWYY